jgi:DNA-binding NarL/FixJ family response regulator
VLKENAVDDILHCLQEVAEGNSYLSPCLSNLLLRQRQSQQTLRHQVPGLDALTPMERRVLKLIAENKTSAQIGGELFVSPRTVETHRHNMCLKLGLNGSHPLLQFALQHRAAL